jgi:hypothetical protein
MMMRSMLSNLRRQDMNNLQFSSRYSSTKVCNRREAILLPNTGTIDQQGKEIYQQQTHAGIEIVENIGKGLPKNK